MANRGNVQYTEAVNFSPLSNQNCNASVIKNMCEIIKINLQEVAGYERIKSNPDDSGNRQPRLRRSGYEGTLDSIRDSINSGSNMTASKITNLLNIENNLVSHINYGYIYTNVGNYSLTIPPKVGSVIIVACGGGGGSAASGANNYSGAPDFNAVRAVAGNGGQSGVYNILMVSGGGGGSAAQLPRGTIDDDPHTEYYAGSAGSPNGCAGGVGGDNDSTTFTAGGAGRGLAYSLVGGAYGKGGDVTTTTGGGYWTCSASGGGGGWNMGTFNVSQGQVLNIVVGGGGAGAINQKYGSTSRYDYESDSFISTGTPRHSASVNNGNAGYVMIKFNYASMTSTTGGNKDHNTISMACDYLLAVSQYFDGLNGCWDSNLCALSCQVSCQQACQLGCQSCQYDTCHNQNCGGWS